MSQKEHTCVCVFVCGYSINVYLYVIIVAYNQAWSHIFVNPRSWWGACEFEDILDYIMSSGPAWSTQCNSLKNKKKGKIKYFPS